MMSPTMSGITYLMTAASMAAGSAMYAFRYRSATNYYDSVLYTGDTNYWKTGDLIRLYGGLAIGGLLATTQLLALLGIAVPLNTMVWFLVGGLGGMILELVVGVFRFLAYEQGYSNAYSTTTAKNTFGFAMMNAVKGDMMEDMAMGAAAMAGLAGAMEGWYFKAWNAVSDEEQAA